MDINTPKVKDIPQVDMSFLNKKWFSYDEYYQACYKVYYEGAWNERKIGVDEAKIESIATEKTIESINKNSQIENKQAAIELFLQDKKGNDTYIRFYNEASNNQFDTFLKDKNTEYIDEVITEIRLIQGRKLLATYPIPLPDLNAETNIVARSEEEIEILFKMIEALYYELYIDVLKAEGINEASVIANQGLGAAFGATNAGFSIALAILGASAVSGLGQVAQAVAIITGTIQILHTIANTKLKKYPKSIVNIKKIVTLLVHFAKITPQNKEILLKGADTYIFMQECEYNDFLHPDEYIVLNSMYLRSIIFDILPKYRQIMLKLVRKGGVRQQMEVMDLFPKAPGKDITNEIDFPLQPQGDRKEEMQRNVKLEMDSEEGNMLDLMRGRGNASMPGCDLYDFEYKKLGWDIKLEKATEIDLLPIHAHNSAMAQTLKTFALEICSMHYCKVYIESSDIAWVDDWQIIDFFKVPTGKTEIVKYKPTSLESFKIIALFDDFARIESNIPLDMKEAEINPHIRKFNAEANFKSLRDNQKRYNQGLYPQINHLVTLALIDESVDRYYRDYMNLWEQVKNKEWERKIEFDTETKKLTLVEKIKVSKQNFSHVAHSEHVYAIDRYEKDVFTLYDSLGEPSGSVEYYIIWYDYNVSLNENELEARYKYLAQNANINDLDIFNAYYGENIQTDKEMPQLNVRSKEYIGNEVKHENIKFTEYQKADNYHEIRSAKAVYINVFFKVVIANETNKGFLQNEINRLKVLLAQEGELQHGGKEVVDSNLDRLQNAGYL